MNNNQKIIILASYLVVWKEFVCLQSVGDVLSALYVEFLFLFIERE